MRVTCPSCQTNYNIDDKRIPPSGAKLKCAKCQTLFAAKESDQSGAVPLPGDSAAAARENGAVPLPSASLAREAATLRDTSIPLPGAVSPPLRAAAPASPPVASRTIAASAPAVPLPTNGMGQVGLASVALPGPSNLKPIQLPGLSAIDDDLDFGFASDEPAPTKGSAHDAGVPPLGALGGAMPDAVATEDGIGEPSEPDVELPGPSEPSSPTEQDFNFDFTMPSDPPPAPAAKPAAPQRPPSPPSGDLNFELNELPTAAVSKESDAAESAAPDNFDFSDPAPTASTPSAAGADLSEPAAAADADSFAVDVGEPPAGAPRGSDENLELLSFADEGKGAAAGDQATALRYHVRRTTGKVFGPFETSIIAGMLQDGQLAGTEELSVDTNEWSPIGSIPAFHEVIASLAQAPPPSAPTAEDVAGYSDADRLKRLYEGRMAAVNVTRSNSFVDVLRERARLLIAAGAVLLVLAAGASLGFTRYGAFGVRKLFSTHVSRSSPQFVMLQNARRDFLADTYKSHRDANELAAAVLKVRDYPDARAVWCQSVFYLQRRFNASKPGEVVKANASLEDIELLGRKDLDYVKAVAGARLAENKAPQAVALLQEAAARNENAEDLELTLLLAEAYGLQGQSRLALETLTKAIDRHKGSARALHALGKLYQANEPEKAAKAFSGALEADPSHLSSAVELAAIDLLSRNNPEKALQSLALADSEKGQSVLGPTELGRVRALKGAALESLGKNRDAMPELEQALKLDSTSLFAKEHLAGLFVLQHEFAKALPLYKDVVDKDTQNLGATEGYLSALIGAAKMDDALKAAAQANARFPGKARIAYLDGRVNDALDRPDEAEKHYKRAINADPKLIDAALYLSRLYLRARRTAEAKAQLEQSLAQAPTDARLRAAIGELAMLQADLPRARAELQKAVELDGKLPEAHLGLSKLALEDGALETARSEVEKAIELGPHVKDGRYQHGVVLWRMKQLDEALSELEKAKAEDLKAVPISIALGAVLLDKGDLPRAEANILAALAMDPINPEGHFYLGKVKNRRGEYSQAIDSMRNALDRAPQRSDYHYEMGVIYRDAKRVNDAIQEWKRAVEIDPSQADSLEALGQAYLDRGEFGNAIDAFEQTLRVDGRRTRMLALIGDCHFQAGKWDPAIAAYLSALKADGSLKPVFYKLGRAYTERGQHARAIDWYRRAVDAEPDKPMAYYYLGYAYKEKHKKKEAIEAFRTYLALKADGADKKDIEDEIYDLQHD